MPEPLIRARWSIFSYSHSTSYKHATKLPPPAAPLEHSTEFRSTNIMLQFVSLWPILATLIGCACGYVDFGTVTAPCRIEPAIQTSRPKFVRDDVYMRYEPYSSSIVAVAPSLRFGRNGTHETSWSLHFVQPPTQTIRPVDRGLRRRGVFSGDPPIPTCRPCDKNGNPINSNNSTNGVPNCSVTDYNVCGNSCPFSRNTNQFLHLSAISGRLPFRFFGNVYCARLLLQRGLHRSPRTHSHSNRRRSPMLSSLLPSRQHQHIFHRDDRCL